MLDWLVEVTTSFKCRQRTYFLAAQLLDDYLRVSSLLENKNVHLLGVTSLYLASKYEDMRPLTSQVISERISHSTHSKKEIIDMHE